RVTVQGFGFGTDSTVTFGGLSATVESVSQTSIVATTPEHLPGIVDVSVASGGDAQILPAAFRFRLSLLSLTPADGPAGGGTTTTVSGAGFGPGTSVSFGAFAAAQVNVVDSRTLQAVTPVGPPGPADVTVTSGSDAATLLGAFTFRTTIDSVS